MIHGVVFSSSALADNSVYADVPAVADQSTNIFNGRYTFQEDRRIAASFLQSFGVTGARITTPTMRLISYPEIEPVSIAGGSNNLPPINFYGPSGPLIVMNDELGIQAGQTSGAAIACDAAIWTDPQPRPAPQGLTTPCRCNGAIVAGARAWTSGPLTFLQQLPAGRYAVTGWTARGANLLFARLIFPNQPTRPMVVAKKVVGEYDWPIWRSGGMGLLGEFHTYAPPQLEIFSSGATTTQVAVIDVVRIGDR